MICTTLQVYNLRTEKGDLLYRTIGRVTSDLQPVVDTRISVSNGDNTYVSKRIVTRAPTVAPALSFLPIPGGTPTPSPDGPPTIGIYY